MGTQEQKNEKYKSLLRSFSIINYLETLKNVWIPTKRRLNPYISWHITKITFSPSPHVTMWPLKAATKLIYNSEISRLRLISARRP